MREGESPEVRRGFVVWGATLKNEEKMATIIIYIIF